jgi:integrase
VSDGELASNPLDRVDLEVIWPLDRRESDWKPDPFSFEEMTAIFAACHLEEEADYWRAAFGTGMRPSEQIALRWPRVDLAGFRIRIEEARVLGLDGDAVKGPKTQAGNRWIDLTAGAYEALQRQFERTGGRWPRVPGRALRAPWAARGPSGSASPASARRPGPLPQPLPDPAHVRLDDAGGGALPLRVAAGWATRARKC